MIDDSCVHALALALALSRAPNPPLPPVHVHVHDCMRVCSTCLLSHDVAASALGSDGGGRRGEGPLTPARLNLAHATGERVGVRVGLGLG